MMAPAEVSGWPNIGRCALRSSVYASLASACVLSLLVGGTAVASKRAHKAEKPAAEEPAAAPPGAGAEPAGEEAPLTESQKEFRKIQWTAGPAKVGIGGHAEIQVPEGFRYTGSSGAQKLLEIMHNPTSGTELGILTDQELELFVLFEFEDIGYVKDADKEKLDAADILKSIKEGNEAGNEERKKRGWPEISIVGWHTPPFYNHETNNLEWCIKGESEGHTIVNYNTRILGRTGVMSANLMVDPEKLDSTLPVVKKLLGGYNFVEGKKYSQYVTGDKIAKYGLSALVVGGAVGLAAKTGLLAKLGVLLAKGAKLIIVGLIALGAGIKKLLFGRKDPPPSSPQAPPTAVAG
jgi:uncharacterized membrane-anchored protein